MALFKCPGIIQELTDEQGSPDEVWRQAVSIITRMRPRRPVNMPFWEERDGGHEDHVAATVVLNQAIPRQDLPGHPGNHSALVCDHLLNKIFGAETASSPATLV